MDARKAALLAGAAGGAAEIVWVVAYAGLMPAANVARGVTATLAPEAAVLGNGPLFGIAIHMLLSLALGLMLGKLLLGLARGPLMLAALGALTAVWALNFLVVLPLVNPAFLTLLPLAA